MGAGGGAAVRSGVAGGLGLGFDGLGLGVLGLGAGLVGVGLGLGLFAISLAVRGHVGVVSCRRGLLADGAVGFQPVQQLLLQQVVGDGLAQTLRVDVALLAEAAADLLDLGLEGFVLDADALGGGQGLERQVAPQTLLGLFRG